MEKDFTIKLACIASAVGRRVPKTKPLANVACKILMCRKKHSVDISVETANRLLNNVYKDVETSALCANTISEQRYDLQIVMPVYNVEKQLEQCIRSVLSQKTCFSYQLIIINDGSPDHSDDIIKRYEGDERIRVIRQENKGFSGARNAGLAEIVAKYVMFVDSDDALADDAIENLMQVAYADDADIVEGNYIRVRNGVESLVRCHETEHVNGTVKLGQPWAKVFKAEMFHNVHYPEKYWFEDTIGAFILYPMAKRVSAINTPVYKYLINPNGISATCKGRAQTLDTLYITRAMLKDDMSLGLLDTEKQRLYEHMFHQIRINFNRTALLGEQVRECVFVVSCDLMERYFSGCYTQREESKALESAIRKRDYKSYVIGCLTFS